MRSRRFVIRTVKKGKVRVAGKDYKPSRQFLVCDGRLDGQRFAFARYSKVGTDLYEPFLSLWGTEASYKTGLGLLEGPHWIKGTLPWRWWREQEETP